MKRARQFPIIRTLFAASLLCVLSLSVRAQQEAETVSQPPGAMTTDIPGPEQVADDAVRFDAVDVFVDAGQESLAAWQFEFQSRTEGVEIVGIEGGDHPAFAAPPFYDPKAMMHNRVILAAFSTAEKLPTGRSRVARIHLQLTGPGSKSCETQLTTCATADGRKIAATHSIAVAAK
ncbi:MAG: hypothetical protein R3C49_01400 [Planctomycetaceae bacterium]